MNIKQTYPYKIFQFYFDKVMFSILNRFSRLFLSSQVHFSIKKKKNILNFTETIVKLIKTSNITSPPPVIFDVGAGIGESVFRFNAYFPNAIYHCFEPSKKSFQILREKTKKLNNKIYFNNFALGDKQETKTFYENAKLDTSSFFSINENHPWSEDIKKKYNFDKFNSDSYPLNTYLLDDYINDNDITKIDLLKIDTQLFEEKVLRGCEKTIEKKIIDFIEVEIHFSSAYSKNYLTIHKIEEIIGKHYRLVSINYFDGVLNIFDDNGNMFTDFLYAKKSLIKD